MSRPVSRDERRRRMIRGGGWNLVVACEEDTTLAPGGLNPLFEFESEFESEVDEDEDEDEGGVDGVVLDDDVGQGECEFAVGS